MSIAMSTHILIPIVLSSIPPTVAVSGWWASDEGSYSDYHSIETEMHSVSFGMRGMSLPYPVSPFHNTGISIAAVGGSRLTSTRKVYQP